MPGSEGHSGTASRTEGETAALRMGIFRGGGSAGRGDSPRWGLRILSHPERTRELGKHRISLAEELRMPTFSLQSYRWAKFPAFCLAHPQSRNLVHSKHLSRSPCLDQEVSHVPQSWVGRARVDKSHMVWWVPAMSRLSLCSGCSPSLLSQASLHLSPP